VESAGPAFIEDSLARERFWKFTSDEQGECRFSDGLVAVRKTRGPYRCDGPDDALTFDQRVDVGVRLMSPDACASIWFRFRKNLGYQVRVCDDQVLVGWHKSTEVRVYRTFPLDKRIAVNDPPTRIRVTASGDTAEITRDGVTLGTVTLDDPDIIAGKVALGIFTEEGGKAGPPEYKVAFNDVKIWRLGF
jgi:hypothetical protein